MKLNIDLDEELERQVRAVAILDGQSVNAWVSNLLRAGVASGLEVHSERVACHPALGSI
jgi:hypothetical protein